MVEAAVTWARENKVKIVQFCPYAKSTLEKTVEWHDVLKQSLISALISDFGRAQIAHIEALASQAI